MSRVSAADFPEGLAEWAGHRSGGVRRMFDVDSGRPAGRVITTPLIERLTSWAEDVLAGVSGVPSSVLLVGGPGNGKTEAVETVVRALTGDKMTEDDLSLLFAGGAAAVRRTVQVQLASGRTAKVVQDASAGIDSTGGSPSALLALELEEIASSSNPQCLYLACVNRGVLDDALTYSVERGLVNARELITSIVRSVALGPKSGSCWPLEGFPTVAVWPMDIESLLVKTGSTLPAGEVLLSVAADPSRWLPPGTCAAGQQCPHCYSAHFLAEASNRESLVKVLRWLELAEGRRWTFRDLASLYSYLLAGASGRLKAVSPCEESRQLAQLIQQGTQSPEALAAPFQLVMSQFEHALFGRWPRLPARKFMAALKDVKLQDDPGLRGLYYFLSGRKDRSLPTALAEQLAALCSALDPAVADPDTEVPLSSRTIVSLRELDLRFNKSIRDGTAYLNRYHALTELESALLTLLGRSDDVLSRPETRRQKPTSARWLQRLLRDFAGRFARRAVGVRGGIVRDRAILEDFRQLVEGGTAELLSAVKQIEFLVNSGNDFEVTLNTTFGEPPPPASRRAVLRTMRQRVRPTQLANAGRPPSSLLFVSVGAGASAQSIPLTYELYRSIRQLELGLLPEALPRTVVALLDSIRAKLAGRLVRDEDALDGSEIRLGSTNETVVRELRTFVVRRSLV